MLKLGVLDFDTSHVVEFTRRLNHRDIEEDQWVDGARVVAGCPGQSRMAPERIPGFTGEMQQLGVPLVDRPEDLIGRVDGMLILSLQGSVHLERARPFIEAGLPCFIDKPFAFSLADARRLVELADRHGVPLFSSSAMRYAPEVVQFLADPARAKLIGAFTHGPAHLAPGNPGLFHYGIHALEMLCTLMGPGCRRVSCLHTEGTDVVTAQWRDGRVGTMRGIRDGHKAYGFVVFTENGVHGQTMEWTYAYRELLKQAVRFFETRKPPLELAVTLEVIALLEAANKSAANGTAWVELAIA